MAEAVGILEVFGLATAFVAGLLFVATVHSVHSNTLCGILPVNSNYLFTTAILSPVIARFV